MQALNDVSLSLNRGEILALLGENGAGKTTLMNILFGHYSADTGQISANGKRLPPESTSAALAAGIGMVHQHFTLADNMSVLENIMLGTENLLAPVTNRRAAREKLNRISHDLGLALDLDSLVADLSIGERQRVEIIKALYRDAKLLILDEPTAVLTPQEVDSLFALLRRMAEQDMAVLIITHKLHEVMAISDRVVVLRQGELVGNFETEEVNRDQLAEVIVGRQVTRPSLEPMPAGDEVLSLNDVSALDGKSKISVLNNINLQVKQHQIIGLAGVSGNGQSSLAAVLSGMLPITSGSLRLLGAAQKKLTPKRVAEMGVARIPEDRHASGIVGEMSIWENLLLEDIGKTPCWRLGRVLNKRAAKVRAQELIEAFDIRCANMDMQASLLSGGNIQKLILARNFLQQPKFVLANQPARGLDEGAIAFVHQQLLDARKAGAGVLLISEDLDELLRLSDFIVVMHDGQLTPQLETGSVSVRDIGTLMTGGSLKQSVYSTHAV